MSSLSAALDRAAGRGPFFALAVLDPVVPAGWQPVDAASVAGYADRTAADLAHRVGHPAEERVVGSLAHLALASRLLSPALVTAAEAGLVPDLALDRLRWRPLTGGPVPLGLVDPRAVGTGDDPAAAIAELVLPTVEALGRMLAPRLAAGLLAGNVASAVATAGRLAPVAAGVAAAVLALPALRAAGDEGPTGFRRRSCCLYYRVGPHAGLCEDCALAR